MNIVHRLFAALCLLGGAALFGIGWGLAGYCPGPALTSLLAGNTEVWVFVPAMLAGACVAAFLVGLNLHWGKLAAEKAEVKAQLDNPASLTRKRVGLVAKEGG